MAQEAALEEGLEEALEEVLEEVLEVDIRLSLFEESVIKKAVAALALGRVAVRSEAAAQAVT